MLRPFTEVILKSIGSSMCFVYSLYRSILTGEDCSIFRSIDWKACAKDPNLKELGKTIIQANEKFRETNIAMITKMKNLLATHLTEKTYFDEDDAKVYAKSLQDRFETTGPIGDTLLEITNMMDFISGKSEGKFKK